MQKVTDITTVENALLTAAAKGQPVTISYMKEEKDPDTGKKTGAMVETVRTIEIYDAVTTKAGMITFKAMDREAAFTDAAEGRDRPGARTWRLDRIVGYTVHRTSYTVEVPQEIAEKLAEKAEADALALAAKLATDNADAVTAAAEVVVDRELERTIDAPPVDNADDMDPAAGDRDFTLAAIGALLGA